MDEHSCSGIVGLGGKVKACKPVVLKHVPCQGAPHGTSHNVLLVCQLLQSNPNHVDMDRISFVGVSDCY